MGFSVKDNIVQECIKNYSTCKPLYEAFTIKMEELIRSILNEYNISVHSVTSRTKDIEKLSEKLSQEGKAYKAFTGVTDLSGVRIICLFSEQVDKIAEIIKETFQVYSEFSVDKREVIDPDRFGYLSLHYVVKLSKERAQLKEYERYSHLFCEIQIRSILQHAWAEIEHDLGYKSDLALPRNIKRRFYRLAGLLELADNEFDQLQEDISQYAAKVDEKIKTAPEQLLVDKISLGKYIMESNIVKEIDGAIASVMEAKLIDPMPEFALKVVEFFGLKTINQLDETLKSNSEGITKYAKDFIERARTAEIRRGISLMLMGYFLAGQSQDTEKVEKYLDMLGFREAPRKTPLAHRIIDVYRKTMRH